MPGYEPPRTYLMAYDQTETPKVCIITALQGESEAASPALGLSLPSHRRGEHICNHIDPECQSWGDPEHIKASWTVHDAIWKHQEYACRRRTAGNLSMQPLEAGNSV